MMLVCVRIRQRRSEVGRTSDGLVEGSLCHLAGLVWGVEDLVVEDGEVEGKTKADWVSRGEISAGDLSCSLVGLEGLVGGVLALVGRGELSEIAVVVALPVVEMESVNVHMWSVEKTTHIL